MDDPMSEKGRQGFELCANEKQETHLKFDQFIIAFAECLVLWVEEMINKHRDAIESGGASEGFNLNPVQPIKQKQNQKTNQFMFNTNFYFGIFK